MDFARKAKTSPNAVAVNASACRSVADLLRSQFIPQDQEDISPAGLTSREVGNFYLLLVSISHQTSPLDVHDLRGPLAAIVESAGTTCLKSSKPQPARIPSS